MQGSKASNGLDCLDTFDDSDPEIDAAPVWKEEEETNRGYGSDDGI
jgi:hypothetical protein